jgi:hypothetical protein
MSLVLLVVHNTDKNTYTVCFACQYEYQHIESSHFVGVCCFKKELCIMDFFFVGHRSRFFVFRVQGTICGHIWTTV